MMEDNFWAPVEPKIAETDEQRASKLQLYKDFVSTFSSESGQRVLEYFNKNTIEAATWVPGCHDGHAQWREGQNSIIREIKMRINNAENMEK